MTESTSTSLRRLLNRSNSRSQHQDTPAPLVRTPDLAGRANEKKSERDCASSVDQQFLTGIELLRVTRKKARTRTFAVNVKSGAVTIDGNFKFRVDAIRDIRVGEEASHYRELCRISSEHEDRWLSIVYYQDNNKLKVLHVICPSTEMMETFRSSLLALYQRRVRLIGAGETLFGHGDTPMDEDIWYSLVPLHHDHDLASTHVDTAGSNLATVSQDKPLANSLTFDEVQSLCHKLHFNASASYLRTIFDHVDADHSGHLDFPAFKKFVDRLKTRYDIVNIYQAHKSPANNEMTRQEFVHFLQHTQKAQASAETLHKIFERAREPTSIDRKESISAANFTSYIVSRRNALLRHNPLDMTQALQNYFISSSHNTYLTGRQVGDDSSIEPYIRVLQKGCRCIEIDIWANSDGYPEVRHGRAFTSAVSLESVLKVVDKYAFIVSPWPLIISLEVRCNPKAQAVIVELLTKTFRDVLVTSLLNNTNQISSPVDLRHRILLKIKSSEVLVNSLKSMDYTTIMQRSASQAPSSPDEALISHAEDSSVSTSAQESDLESPRQRSRTSSVSSRSSGYSNSHSSTSYRPFAKPSYVVEELACLAPYFKGAKFRNFSLPESKTFNHIFSLSERSMKQFSPETLTQLRKHNTRFMMRVYPSQARLMSSNFLPHHYWQRGVQMAAMNWQTHDAGMRMNDAFFAIDDHSADTLGYMLKPAHMRHWEKGQESVLTQWKRQHCSITIVSGSQLTRAQNPSGKMSPVVELEVYRPLPAQSRSSEHMQDKARESRFKTGSVGNNGFNPVFNHEMTFHLFEDEDPCFTFLQFVVRDTHSGEILGQAFVPLERLQMGYRVVGLYDHHGERFMFSSLLIKVSMTDV